MKIIKSQGGCIIRGGIYARLVYQLRKEFNTIYKPIYFKPIPELFDTALLKKDILEKIDNKIEVEKGSPEETEIRASTIWAVEFIKEEVKKRSPQIISFQINDDLWLATQGNNNGNKLCHRTRTTAY